MCMCYSVLLVCTHMVLECVDSYVHWAATKQQLYRVSTTTLQTLHARVVWRVVIQGTKNFSPTLEELHVKRERWPVYNNIYVAVARAQNKVTTSPHTWSILADRNTCTQQLTREQFNYGASNLLENTQRSNCTHWPLSL